MTNGNYDKRLETRFTRTNQYNCELKIPYETIGDALRAIRYLASRRKRKNKPYKCKVCNKFHLTRK